jgi:hypothetical protein
MFMPKGAEDDRLSAACASTRLVPALVERSVSAMKVVLSITRRWVTIDAGIFAAGCNREAS